MVQAPPPAKTFGHYTLLEELGRGGQGTVWLAEDHKLKRKVALKLLRTAAGTIDEHQLERFRREAEAASKIDHPNICALFDAGDVDGVPYLAFRHVEGETLAERISQAQENDGDSATSKAGIQATVVLFEKLARALHKAHEQGLIHRDIKPGNIMVTDEGEPIVLDFGLARDELADEHTLTHSGDLIGTPAYMSPEQLMANRVPLDRRTDVYSLGATLYECLTLQRPFGAPTRAELYQKILHSEPSSASSTNRQIPRDLQVIVETAMEKDRNRRYQTAQDFAEDLRLFREFAPIKARPIGRLLRVKRWGQRHPAATATAVLLTVGLVGLGTMLLRVRAERNRAVAAALGSASAEVLPSNPRLALLIGLAAVDRCTDPEQRPLLVSRIHAALGALRERSSFSLGSDASPIAMRFDPDGRSVLLLFEDHSIQRFAFDGTPLPLAGDEQDVDAVFPTRPGWAARVPARAALGDTVLVSDGANVRASKPGHPVKLLLHPDWVSSVALAHDGRAITAARDGVIRLWKPDLELEGVFRAGGNGCFDGRPDLVRFSPDGRLVLSSDMDRNLGLLWAPDAPGTPLARIEHGSSITHLSFHPADISPKWILSASYDQTAKITGITGEATGVTVTEMRGHITPVHAAAISSDGETVGTVSEGKKLILWDVRGELPSFFAHKGGVMSIRWSSDGLLITGGRDGWVRIWTPDGRLMHGFDTGAFKIHLAEDTPLHHVLTRGDRADIAVWSRDGAPVFRWPGKAPRDPNDGLVMLDPDGSYRLERLGDLRPTELESAIRTESLPCYSPDRGLVIFNGSTPHMLNTRTGTKRALTEGRVYYAIDSSQTLSASGSAGYLCDHQDRVRHRMLGHEGEIFGAVLAPNGETAITLSRDRTARLWSTTDGRLLAVLPHEGIVRDAVFTAECKRVYTASFDGWVRCWFVEERELLDRARKRAAAFSYTEAEENRLRELLGH